LLTSSKGSTQAAAQSSSAPRQVCEQVPPTQASPAGQSLPHPPQLPSLVARSTQLPLQMLWPLGQVVPQWPAEHAWPLVQATPQPPQLAPSVLVSTQASPQRVRPVGQLAPHLPLTQNWPLGQALPQLPQLLLSPCSSTQAVPHSEKPPRQADAQTPTTQAWPLGQAPPQAPQFAVSFSRSAQTPEQSVRLPQRPASGWPLELPLLELPLLEPWLLLRLPPLLPPPSGPCGELHAPRLQVAPVVQALPQAPQLELSVSGSTQLPAQETLEPGQPPPPASPVGVTVPLLQPARARARAREIADRQLPAPRATERTRRRFDMVGPPSRS
jgi:hypothetical protein